MIELANIEFSMLPDCDGSVEVRLLSEQSTFMLRPGHREFVVPFIERLKEEHPIAYQRLERLFFKSRENRIFFEYLICRRFIKCNFGVLDNRPDIDEDGNFIFEYVQCPHAGECPDYGYVCNSHETKLLKSETNVLRLIVSGHTNKEISEILFISEHTVHNHRNNMLKRLNLKNTADLTSYWYKKNLK